MTAHMTGQQAAGLALLADHAPIPTGYLSALTGTERSGIAPAVVAAVRAACADVTGLPALTAAILSDTNAGATVEVAADLAGQFAMDVTGVTAEDRDRARAVFGDDLRALLAEIHIADWAPRILYAAEILLGPAGDGPVGDGDVGDGAGGHAAGQAVASTAEPGRPVWEDLDRFMRAVARLDGLDVVTTELVRLRAARQHDCRVCRSLRSSAALTAGADEELFAAVDHHTEGTGRLTDRHRAALALTDALIWSPAAVDPATVAAVRAHFTAAETVELLLDLMRNAISKIAVAAGSDAPRVTGDDVEFYALGVDGDVVIG